MKFNESIINDKIVLRGYLVSGLWSSTDDEGEPLDYNFSINDINKQSIRKAEKDVKDFIRKAGEDLLQQFMSFGYDEEQIGHDFWLTRNGHGTGFWDRRAEGIGDKLTKIAKSFGEVYPYVGDNGEVFMESVNKMDEIRDRFWIVYKNSRNKLEVLDGYPTPQDAQKDIRFWQSEYPTAEIVDKLPIGVTYWNESSKDKSKVIVKEYGKAPYITYYVEYEGTDVVVKSFDDKVKAEKFAKDYNKKYLNISESKIKEFVPSNTIVIGYDNKKKRVVTIEVLRNRMFVAKLEDLNGTVLDKVRSDNADFLDEWLEKYRLQVEWDKYGEIMPSEFLESVEIKTKSKDIFFESTISAKEYIESKLNK